jgi:F-type H+-transporting ATPase subunit delta
MQNPRLASRYAKSLMDIAIEQNKLDAVYNDVNTMNNACHTSTELMSVIRSPIIKADKKNAIIAAIFGDKVDKVTIAFTTLIVNKGRDYFLPEILVEFIAQYKTYNKVSVVKLTTAAPLDSTVKQAIEDKIKSQLQGMNVELDTYIDENLLGGFVLEANNNLFDASIRRDLDDIKKQFLTNVYVPELR